MSRQRLVATLLLALVAVSWGAIPLIVRGDVPWQQLVAARVWLGALTLIVVLAVRGKLRLPQTDRWRIVVSGLLLAAHWATFFLAITETTVAITLAILYLGPVLASGLAVVVLGERPTRRVVAGLGVALVGVLIVVRPGGEASALGLVASLVSGLTFAGLMLVGKPAAGRIGPLVFAAGELIIAAVVLGPWAVQAAVESASYWPQLLILGVLLTGVADFVFWQAMQHLPVAAVSVLMYLEPASAIIWAALFLDESPDPIVWIGIVLVVAGGALSGSEVTREEEAIVAPTAI